MKMKFWITAILACGIFTVGASGQRHADPAPNPAGSGPSLAETMQLLQEKLNEQGKMSWTTHYHDSADNTNWIYDYIFEVSKVVADASACTIAYHYKITIDGVQKFDRDASLDMRDVQDITQTTGDEHQDKNDVAAGRPTWSAKADPPHFILIVQGKGNLKFYFYFFNEDTANRVTKAMGHAVELCGGSRGSF
ncbi:MAG: hypothetical protein ABSF16_03745 [Terracidiphilus sp.]|jgi:hypothetical protein